MRIQIENTASPKLRKIASRTLSDARAEMTRKLAAKAISTTADLNPVRTGRSRQAWLNALRSLNQQGQSNQASEGHSTSQSTPDQTEITATNNVEYVSYLEYGTSLMSPFAMVRNSLLQTLRFASTFFKLK